MVFQVSIYLVAALCRSTRLEVGIGGWCETQLSSIRDHEETTAMELVTSVFQESCGKDFEGSWSGNYEVDGGDCADHLPLVTMI